jgi:hypothetical protein
VSSINDLGVIMNEKMTISEYVDVMVVKAFAMLGFIRRLSLELLKIFILLSLSTCLWFVRNWNTQVAWWNQFYDTRAKGGLFDLLCVVWVGHTCMIYHRMRTDEPFCILTPLQKGDWLLVWCFTHQTCCPFSIWSHRNSRLAVTSFCVLISIERSTDVMNQCRVRCARLMRSLVFLISVRPGISFWIV